MKRFAVLLVAMTCWVGSAHAANYQQEYLAWKEALQKGDKAGAAKHAKAAWEVAKTGKQDARTVAVLAFNYGSLIFASDPGAAIAPLQEAANFSPDDTVLYGDDTPDLLLGYCQATTRQQGQNDFGRPG